ncbi:type II/IV secretion system protein [Candidatus Falkowbacteria bacterium]|nr:type II/IV secretion system protein [Candidatus Falkowbacteria bacterium]
MSKDTQSIEDLITSSQGQTKDDESAQAKLSKREGEIKIKEIERLTGQQAAAAGAPYVNLVGFPISPEALSLLKEEEAVEFSTVCFYYDGKNLRLAATNPADVKVITKLKELKDKHYCQGVLYLISENSLNYALKLYKSIPKVREFIRGVKITEEDLDKYSEQFSSFHDLQNQVNGAKVTEIVTVIMAASFKAGSSDIHVEAEEKDIKVRFRIDGVLHDVAALDKELWKKIISRLKVLTGVKINISDKPQDGRMSIFTKKERIDIRASFLPTNFGESVVMRLLRSSSVGLSFEDLGLRGGAYERLKREVERPNGMIITTGPTGSGKTTTLYAVLKKLNNPETKIITIEDPIEYQLEGINQSQTSERYTFAQGLRSIVRQDPDILMVGEIRDLETAEIAIQAALTGHLVVSTIHTNDAAGTVPRLLSMGAKPFLIAPAVNAMIGQRLVRKICSKCKMEDNLSEENMKRARKILEKLPAEEKKNVNFDNLKFFKGTGCDYCQGIGFKGRIGIYEIMIMNPEIEKLILTGNVSEYDMRDNAAKNGMVTMVQDGVLKALDGITSIDEVFRVAE